MIPPVLHSDYDLSLTDEKVDLKFSIASRKARIGSTEEQEEGMKLKVRMIPYGLR